MNPTMLKKMAAEAIGTFILVFVAVGAAVTAGVFPVVPALAFGLVIVVLASTAVGAISGCHINPAVSLAVLITQKLTKKTEFGYKEFGLYVAAQFVGAFLGALLLHGILAMSDFAFAFGYGANAVTHTAGGVIGGVLFEIVLTCIFVYIVLFAANNEKTKKYAGLLIGAGLTLVHLVGIGFTGTSVNPARSFGPAFWQGVFGEDWDGMKDVTVFLLAPMAGAALAALIYYLVHLYKKSDKPAPALKADLSGTEDSEPITADGWRPDSL